MPRCKVPTIIAGRRDLDMNPCILNGLNLASNRSRFDRVAIALDKTFPIVRLCLVLVIEWINTFGMRGIIEMNGAESMTEEVPLDEVPEELLALFDRVRALPSEVRGELEPIVRDALEEARFRGRVLGVAREALERLRFDLELTKFDLDATRREREVLRKRLGTATH